MDIGNFHPIIVHFPVVFFTLTVVFDLAQYFFFDKRPSYYSHWLFLVGAVTVVPSIITGLLASNAYPDSLSLHLHKALAFFLAALIFTQVAIRIGFLRNYSLISSKYVVFFSVIIFLIVSLTGDVGGVLARGTSPFQIGAVEEQFDYNSADPKEVRKYTPQQLTAYLIKKINVMDVIPIFERYRCARCHSDKFEGKLPSKFTAEPSPWLTRNENGELVDWEESSFYETTILYNRMPIDAEKNSLGISWSERLLLIRWLENNAPTTPL
jgi:uncharacterized membrane protein